MRTFFLLLCCMLPAAGVHAVQTCKPDSIPASTPDSQFVDNGDGTITDLKTGLMWKKCLEGVSGNNCEAGSPSQLTWQQVMQHIKTINNNGGLAGHNDWRLPNIKELRSLVEEQCFNPAINLTRFPNQPPSEVWVWSASPAPCVVSVWTVRLFDGGVYISSRDSSNNVVRLVRGGN